MALQAMRHLAAASEVFGRLVALVVVRVRLTDEAEIAAEGGAAADDAVALLLWRAKQTARHNS